MKPIKKCDVCDKTLNIKCFKSLLSLQYFKTKLKVTFQNSCEICEKTFNSILLVCKSPPMHAMTEWHFYSGNYCIWWMCLLIKLKFFVLNSKFCTSVICVKNRSAKSKPHNRSFYATLWLPSPLEPVHLHLSQTTMKYFKVSYWYSFMQFKVF